MNPFRAALGPLIALAAALIAAALFAAGCGGDEDGGPAAEVTLPPGHESVLVIEDWVTKLSSGQVSAAAELFALPSVVENGTPPFRLRTRADAVFFNRGLPCGAELVRARPAGRLVAATFRLTERPGGDCGAGVGGLARTAFLIRNGKIVQWRRLPDPDDRGPSGPVV